MKGYVDRDGFPFCEDCKSSLALDDMEEVAEKDSGAFSPCDNCGRDIFGRAIEQIQWAKQILEGANTQASAVLRTAGRGTSYKSQLQVLNMSVKYVLDGWRLWEKGVKPDEMLP